MSQQEYIRIRGARENNLKNISLDIPKRNSISDPHLAAVLSLLAVDMGPVAAAGV